MKDFFLSGQMPYKLDIPLDLQMVFRSFAQQLLVKMFNILNEVNPSDYPYANYSLGKDSEGNMESGIQITIEADIFGDDHLILRRHLNGYTAVMTSIDDNIGSMEYEFDESDELVNLIPQHVQHYLNEKVY